MYPPQGTLPKSAKITTRRVCVATAAPHTPKIASMKAAELKQLTSAPISTQAKPYFIAPMSPARAATEHSGAERNPDMH